MYDSMGTWQYTWRELKATGTSDRSNICLVCTVYSTVEPQRKYETLVKFSEIYHKSQLKFICHKNIQSFSLRMKKKLKSSLPFSSSASKTLK